MLCYIVSHWWRIFVVGFDKFRSQFISQEIRIPKLTECHYMWFPRSPISSCCYEASATAAATTGANKSWPPRIINNTVCRKVMVASFAVNEMQGNDIAVQFCTRCSVVKKFIPVIGAV